MYWQNHQINCYTFIILDGSSIVSKILAVNPSSVWKSLLYTVNHKNAPLFFLNSFMQHWLILIILGQQHHEETWCKWLYFWPSHFNTVASLHYLVQVVEHMFWAHAVIKRMWCDMCCDFLRYNSSLLYLLLFSKSFLSQHIHYPVWIHCCKWPNYDFCISQGSVATVLKWGGQN